MFTRLRLSFSHLHEHKFRHGFKDTLNPLCSCSIEAKTTTHYFLRCHFHGSIWATLMNDLEIILIPFSTVCDNNLISLLLYGDDTFDETKNRKILMSTIRFIKDSQRFDEQLFWQSASMLRLPYHFYLSFCWRFCFTLSKS